MILTGITMLDKDLEPDYFDESPKIKEDLLFNDLDDVEVPESVYIQATHQYECKVYNDLEKKLSRRDYVS